FEARFFLVPGEPTHYVDAKLSVIRHRTITGSFNERLTVLNHQEEPVEVTLRLWVGSDFADLFEIKDVQGKQGKASAWVDNGRLRLAYERNKFRREATISSSAPAQVDPHGFTFPIRLEPHGQWET